MNVKEPRWGDAPNISADDSRSHVLAGGSRVTMTIADDAPPVEHRFLGLDRRKIWATLGVLALVIFWGTVIPGINEAIDADEIEPGTVLSLKGLTGATMSFTPTPGWVVEGVPLPSEPTLSIFTDGITFAVSFGTFEGTPDELLDTVRALHDDFNFEGEPQAFSTASGIPGSAVELVEIDEDGALFAMVATNPDAAANPAVAGSVGIQVVVEGPPAALDDHTEDIGEMIASFTVEFPAEEAES
jgi:hypothetical protein